MQKHPKQRRIVFCLDSSENSNLALQWGFENHVRHTDMVILLSIGETAEKTISEGERYIESISPAAGSRPQIARAPLKGKDPRDAIVDHCKDVKADALILGSRGLSGVKRALLGSVSDYCARNVQDCAVIIVK